MSNLPPVGDDRGIQKHAPSGQQPSSEDQKTTTLAKIIIAKGTHYTRELDVKEQYSIVQREGGWFWGNLAVIAIKFFDLIRNKEPTSQLKLTQQEAQKCLISASKSQNKSEVTFLENYIISEHSAKLIAATEQAKPHDYMDSSWKQNVLKELDQTIEFCDQHDFDSLKQDLVQLKTTFNEQWDELSKQAESSLKDSIQAAEQADKDVVEKTHDQIGLQEQLLLLQETTITHLTETIESLKQQELELDLKITQGKSTAESKAKEDYASKKQKSTKENEHSIEEKANTVQELTEKMKKMKAEIDKMQPEASKADQELKEGAWDLRNTKQNLVQAQLDRIAVYKKQKEKLVIFQEELDDLKKKRETYHTQMEAVGAQAREKYEIQNKEQITKLEEIKKDLLEKGAELDIKKREKVQMVAKLTELKLKASGQQ